VYQLPELFTPVKVADIARSDKKLLQALASEPERERKRRELLEEEQKDLQKALDDCKARFGDINEYILNTEGPLNSGPVLPTVNALSEPWPVATTYADDRSSGKLPLGQARSRASSSSILSVSPTSTQLTIPSPEGSVSGRVGGKRRLKRPSKGSLDEKRASQQKLSSEEEL
jgi:hypothetical protein